jgi:hypothetical protein
MSIEESTGGEISDDDPEEQCGPDGRVFAYGADCYHGGVYQEVSCPAKAAMSETGICPNDIRDVTRRYDTFAVNIPDEPLEGHSEEGVIPEETARKAWDRAIEKLRNRAEMSDVLSSDTQVVQKAEQVAEALGWRE